MALALIGGALIVTVQAEEAAAPAGKVKLKLDLPAAMFTGTPKNIKTPFLEPPRPPGARAAFYVPEGVTNVSAKKKVTASDSEPVIGSLDLVTDGDKEGTDGSYVEFGPGKQWVQIDLGQAYAIYAVAMWHDHRYIQVMHDVIVQVSDDADFAKGVTTVYNNDSDNSSGLGVGADREYFETYRGRIVDGKGVKGRYVRAYTKGSSLSALNCWQELEVYALTGQ